MRVNILIFIILVIKLFGENNATAVETCKLVSSQSFGYTGDVSGKRVFTKEEFLYSCSSVSTEKGTCKKKRSQVNKMNVGKLKGTPVYYKTEDFSGTMGDMLAVTQAYNKINGLWAGYHGFCQKGMDDNNFAWMSDPYTLAGYALDMVSAGYASKAQDAAEAANAAGQLATSSATSVGTLAAEKTAEAAAKAYATQQIVKMSICATTFSIDTAKMIVDYNSKDEPCDPIDEICDAEKNGASDKGNIFTISAQSYNDMLAGTPDMADYTTIIDGKGTKMLTVKVGSPPAANSANIKNMKAAEDEKKKIKNMKLAINAAMTTASTVSCMLGGGTGSTSQQKGSSLTSVDSMMNYLEMGVGAINPLFGMGLSIGMNVYNSLQPINTCDNMDDAKAKGSRHESTNNALHHGMCHLIEVKTTGSGTLHKREKYRYCCYNDKTTRILVEQTKAQLGKNWVHCTDISPNELVQLSFRSCDPELLDANINGVNLDAYASDNERFSAYQYKEHCIDTREYMSYMLSKFGGKSIFLDKKTLQDLLKDFK